MFPHCPCRPIVLLGIKKKLKALNGFYGELIALFDANERLQPKEMNSCWERYHDVVACESYSMLEAHTVVRKVTSWESPHIVDFPLPLVSFMVNEQGQSS